MVREWIDTCVDRQLSWCDGDNGDFSDRDGTRDQQFDNSMTHNDSQNALRKRKCDYRVDIL